MVQVCIHVSNNQDKNKFLINVCNMQHILILYTVYTYTMFILFCNHFNIPDITNIILIN